MNCCRIGNVLVALSLSFQSSPWNKIWLI
jgi:hypothetical protein